MHGQKDPRPHYTYRLIFDRCNVNVRRSGAARAFRLPSTGTPLASTGSETRTLTRRHSLRGVHPRSLLLLLGVYLGLDARCVYLRDRLELLLAHLLDLLRVGDLRHNTRGSASGAPRQGGRGAGHRRCTSAPLDTIDPSPGSLSFLAPSLPSPPALPVHTGRRRCVRAVRAGATATATAAHPLLGNDGVVSRALRGLQRLQLRSLLQTLLPRGLRLLRRAQDCGSPVDRKKGVLS